MRRVLETHFADTPQILGVEIGCLNGGSANRLLTLHPGLTLHSIDPFIPDSMAPKLIGSEKRARELNRKHGERFVLHVAYSWDIASQFKPDSLDVLFIDGDHRYAAVRKDLRLYAPKLKIGGLLFVHDCRMSRGGAHFHVGPSKLADEELFNNPKWWGLVGEAFSLAAFQKVRCGKCGEYHPHREGWTGACPVPVATPKNSTPGLY
jgi:hypothetical protein